MCEGIGDECRMDEETTASTTARSISRSFSLHLIPRLLSYPHFFFFLFTPLVLFLAEQSTQDRAYPIIYRVESIARPRLSPRTRSPLIISFARAVESYTTKPVLILALLKFLPRATMLLRAAANRCTRPLIRYIPFLILAST